MAESKDSDLESQAVPTGISLMISVAGRLCLVVGGGGVAARRAPLLARNGARVVVIAPWLHPVLRQSLDSGHIGHVSRVFQNGDTAGAFLTLAATDDPEVNRLVAGEVLERGGLVAVAHDPRLGNCTFMAATARGPLVVAIQTGGASPLVSAALRTRIDALLPETLETNLEKIAAIRQELKAHVTDPIERGRRWKAAAERGLVDRLLFDGDDRGAQELRLVLGFDS